MMEGQTDANVCVIRTCRQRYTYNTTVASAVVKYDQAKVKIMLARLLLSQLQ